MEVAKVTSKGQITVPISVRRRLRINEGDKLLFIDRPDGVMIVNPNMLQAERADETAPAAASPGNAPGAAQHGNAQGSASRVNAPGSAQHGNAPFIASTVYAPAVPYDPAGAAVEGRTPAIADRARAEPEAGAPRTKGYDVTALLNEIRSIGSKI